MSTLTPNPLSAVSDGSEVTSQRGEPTWEVARLYPRQGEWSESEYLALDAAGGRLIELSDGVIEFLPMPDYVHQFIFEFLFDALRAFLRETGVSGRVIAAPFPIRILPGILREPDIVFLRPERMQNRRQPPNGADLTIEIVSRSPKDRERDFETKRLQYGEARIPEYWIVDPETRTIHVLTLDGVEPGAPYRTHGEFKAGETATSLLLEGFRVSVDDIFKAGEGELSPSPNAPSGRD